MGKNLKGKEIGTGIRQRKDGRYEARAEINGIKICIYDKSLTTLKKRFEEEKLKYSKEDDDHYDRNITVLAWYEIWFEQVKSPQLKSIQSRLTHRRKFVNTLGKLLGAKPLKELTQMNIQMAANDLVENYNYTTRTVRESIGVLRECLDIAVVNGIINVNPCISIRVRDGNELQKERRVIDHWEQDLLFEVIQGSYYEEAYKILLLTGMRIGEFSGLWWEDVDFENKVIHIRRSMSTGYNEGIKMEELTAPKTANSYRDIPFFEETEELFKSWQKKQHIYKERLGKRWRVKPELGDLVFTSSLGSPVTRYVLIHDINKVAKEMQLLENDHAMKEGRMPRAVEGLYPHAFRHTFATRCFERGMEPIVVQRIMGHANYSTTVSYTHVLNQIRDREVKKIGKFFM